MPSVVRDVRAARVVMILAALLVARAGEAATPTQDAPAAAPAVFLSAVVSGGKSFLDQVRTTYAEEPSYSVPATFPGPLAPSPRKPETPAMLLACLGLLALLGSRRQKALAGSP